MEQAKARILDAALALFRRLDYGQVSIRKVAAKAGCSPATIYNYYPSKDALYLDVLKSGFEILLASFRAGADLNRPLESIRELARRLWRFSLDYPAYYDLMFTLPVPKYLDYVGTDMERAAAEEKAVAVANLDLAQSLVEAAVAKGELAPTLDPRAAALLLMSAAHGVISLHRSGVMAEIDAAGEETYLSVVEGLLTALAAR